MCIITTFTQLIFLIRQFVLINCAYIYMLVCFTNFSAYDRNFLGHSRASFCTYKIYLVDKMHTVLLTRRFICATSITFIKKLITKITRQQAVAKLQKHFKIFLLIVIFFSFIKYIVHYWIYIFILNNIMHACCENGMKIFISKCICSLALLWHCYSLILW